MQLAWVLAVQAYVRMSYFAAELMQRIIEGVDCEMFGSPSPHTVCYLLRVQAYSSGQFYTYNCNLYRHPAPAYRNSE